MRRLFAMLLAVALCAGGWALAESAREGGGTKTETLIEDGEFIIRVDAQGDLAWTADDMAQDPSVVKLESADTVEGVFEARYAPTGDGDVTVAVRHYAGAACDELMTWDLHVEGGAVREATGGSYAATVYDEAMDAAMVGEWLEKDTQFAVMTVEKNPARGYDIEIVSPLTHGAYVFKTSVLYDCELGGFVYDKGKFWDVPITDSEEETELGEAKVMGATGIFNLTGDGEDLVLEWYDDGREGESVFFTRG